MASCTRLLRPRLSLLNGVTALAGAALFPAPPEWRVLLAAFAGVTVLAMGGSALNQVLERDLDALMARTTGRPLPQGRMGVPGAAGAGIMAILAGLLLLAVRQAPLPPLLGGMALCWYLLVYTPLKRRTSLALPLGGLCGAIPPLIGWCLAGGEPGDFRILLLAGLLFLWQIPHFWLLQQRHSDDYRRAGIPLLDSRALTSSRFSLRSVWLVALTAATLLLPLLGVLIMTLAPAALLLSAVPVIAAAVRSERLQFQALNAFPLLLCAVILVQHLGG